MDGPVVLGLDPGAAEQVDGRIGQFIDVDRDRRLVEDQLVLAGDFHQHIGGVLDIVAVADPEYEVDTPDVSACEVDDRVAPGLLVGDDQDLVVERSAALWKRDSSP